jgi:glycosyltransferase involved in cell wall biosynthesis
MKVLLYCDYPFSLAHGGATIQVQQTYAALGQLGVEVEYLRWWDEAQRGDVIHYVARVPTPIIRLAHRHRIKVVQAELLTAQGSRPRWRLWVQRTGIRALRRVTPPGRLAPFAWESYREADACVALTQWEAHLMSYLFGAPRERVHVVPNGVETVFFESPRRERGRWLVCTATLTARKRVVEVAEGAAQAGTPVWFIGKPYGQGDAYSARFLELVGRHPDLLRFEGPVEDRGRLAAIYREARGFVLLSAVESLSLSALEAAACECPLLLSDLPWARWPSAEQASYAPAGGPAGRTAAALRKFYDAAPGLPPPARPLTWSEVAARLKAIYEQITGKAEGTRNP